MAMCYDDWNNLLPKDLLIDIVDRLSFQEDYYVFSAVCKSWNSAAAATDKPWWLPTRIPMLLLAEEVAPGSILFDADYDLNQDYGDTYDEQEKGYNYDDVDKDSYDYLKDSVGTSRGIYSLSSMKTYNLELPEAAGKLILSTSKGWLLTLGRDLQINLLHPLLRHKFSLPPMHTFPRQPGYHERYTPHDATEQFIGKVAMSYRLSKKNTHVTSFHHHATSSPIVMAVYGELDHLGFARLGDSAWTDVHVPSHNFQDIVYHKGKFYAVNFNGDVYVCSIDDDKKKGLRGTKIASIETYDCDQKYLVESLSGSGLLVLVRYKEIKHFEKPCGIVAKYRTTHFAVWRLDLTYYDSLENPSYTLTEENSLGNEAIFVGRAASLSVSSSEIIRPNSIYFTDDNWESYLHRGGGHDMGIFDMERRTIEPHFQGKSLHCISPPLWQDTFLPMHEANIEIGLPW